VQEFPQPVADLPDPDSLTMTAEMRQQYLIKRITVGVLLVAGLFGAWVMMDTLPPTPPRASIVHDTAPARQARQTGGAIPSEPSAAVPVPPVPAPAPAMVPPAASQAAAPPVVSPPPVATATVLAPAAAMSAPAMMPAPPIAVPLDPKEVIAEPKDVPQSAVTPAPKQTTTHAPSRPAAHASPRPPKGKATGDGQFGVQMGVFKIATNAEKLRAQMELNDIPVVLEKHPTETRVLAGPFATRVAAENARARLGELGLGKGMLVPLKKMNIKDLP
jgi:cell division protein FtsN